MTRRQAVHVGFANPDGTGRGNWSHASEQRVGRITRDQAWDQRYGKRERRAVCRDCGFTHGRIRYSHAVQASPDGSSLLELVAGVLVILVNFLALFYALPIIAAAVMR